MNDHLVRAAQARRRADLAGMRAAGLRQRRVTGQVTTSSALREELDIAQAHAIDAMEHLLDALENSALAHDRAADRYALEAGKSEVAAASYAAKVAGHRAAAEADRVRARLFQKEFDLLLVADEPR